MSADLLLIARGFLFIARWGPPFAAGSPSWRSRTCGAASGALKIDPELKIEPELASALGMIPIISSHYGCYGYNHSTPAISPQPPIHIILLIALLFIEFY